MMLINKIINTKSNNTFIEMLYIEYRRSLISVIHIHSVTEETLPE